MEWEKTQSVRLFRLIDRMRRAWAAITPCAGLSKSQFGPLMALAHLGGGPGLAGQPPQRQAQGLPLTQLAHGMHQSPPALSQRIAALEAMGYVQRTEDAQDRRVTRVHLTPQGNALLKQAYHAMNEKLNSALDALGEQDTAMLFTLLNKFTAQLEQAAGIEWEEN